MTGGETDPVLRRLERDAAVACGIFVVVGFVAGGVEVALGVVGGGVLIGTSYWAIKTGVDALLEAAGARPDAAARAAARGVVRLAGRYALLALLAYAMIARLRLHPVGLLLGASSIVAAALAEAVRSVTGVRSRRSP